MCVVVVVVCVSVSVCVYVRVCVRVCSYVCVFTPFCPFSTSLDETGGVEEEERGAEELLLPLMKSIYSNVDRCVNRGTRG